MGFEGNVKPSSIEQATLEPDLSAQRVVGQPSNNQELVEIIGNIVYIGTACRGFATTDGVDDDNSKPNWLIQKVTLGTATFSTQIAWGRWSNKLSLTYA